MKELNEMGFRVLSQEECLIINGGTKVGNALRWCKRAAENTWEFIKYQVAGCD